MLSKKDKEWIENTVKKIVYDVLTVEIKYEKNRDEKTGQPLATPEIIIEKEFLPVWWIRYLPHYEAAMRGVQGQVSQHHTAIDDFSKKLDVIGQLLLHTEQSMKQIASFADKLNELEYNEVKKLDYVEADLDEENDESNS